VIIWSSYIYHLTQKLCIFLYSICANGHDSKIRHCECALGETLFWRICESYIIIPHCYLSSLLYFHPLSGLHCLQSALVDGQGYQYSFSTHLPYTKQGDARSHHHQGEASIVPSQPCRQWGLLVHCGRFHLVHNPYSSSFKPSHHLHPLRPRITLQVPIDMSHQWGWCSETICQLAWLQLPWCERKTEKGAAGSASWRADGVLLQYMPTGTAESRFWFHELFITSVRHSLVICAAHRSFIFFRDNISDGMMTRDTNVLADCVMNALWFRESICLPPHPEKNSHKTSSIQENSLENEYYVLLHYLHGLTLLLLVSGHVASQTVDLTHKRDSKRRWNFSLKQLTSRLVHGMVAWFLISNHILMFAEILQVFLHRH